MRALALVLAVLSPSVVAAADLQGVVQDELGRVIVGADVTVACRDFRQRVVTDERGEFRVANVPDGACTVSAEAARLARVESDVTVPAARRLVVTLPVKGLSSDVVVTASRGTRETSFETPQGTSVVAAEDVMVRPHRLLMQALREEPGVLVQQTTTGQTSPVIRGFTGQSNVYLVDGVRFNVATWRPGASQYTAWLDGAAMSRLEIVRGPASVQYGSDALGGVVNVLPAIPSLSAGGASFGGEAMLDVASADRSGGGQASVAIQHDAVAFRAGASGYRVGELRAGERIDSRAAVTRFLGLPSSAVFERMPATGYERTSAFVTGRARAGSRGEVTGLYLHHDLTGSSRYDRIDGGNGVHRSGFDPQTLDFAVFRYRQQLATAPAYWSAALSLNRQSDGRFEQSRPASAIDRQRALTTSVGYQAEGQRVFGRHRLQAGLELYRESIEASREQVNVISGAAVVQRPDVPDGTRYDTFGVFVSDVIDIGRLRLSGGIRYGRYRFATAANPALAVGDERLVQQAVTFNAGAVVSLTRTLNATFNAARGYRAANAADLGSIGLTGGGGFEISPSRAASLGGVLGTTAAADAVSTGMAVPGLAPEVVYSFEPGLRFRTGRYGASVTVFDLEYFDSIQRRAVIFPASVVGTSISGFTVVRRGANGEAYLAEDIRPIATRANVDHARIIGLEVEGDAEITRSLSARAFWSMSNGHVLATGEYLSKMPPPMGGASLRWDAGRLWAEGWTSFARAQTRLSSSDLGDARLGATRTRAAIASYFNGTATDRGVVRAGILQLTGETLAQVQQRVLGTANSAPLFTEMAGFLTVGLRGGVRLSDQLDAVVIGENLMDRNYRLVGSGADAPGRNVQLRLRFRF